MYATGAGWKSWMKDYRFGTLAFVPHGDLRLAVDRLRFEYDEISAKISMAHVTLTQPLAKEPTPDEIQKIKDVVSSLNGFEIVVGPFTTSPNKRLNWLDVSPKETILNLRELLHDTGLFRTDMPFTNNFIPHMTISEEPRELDEVSAINAKLNAQFSPWSTQFASIAWIIPDEDFVFREHQSINLGR